MDVARLREQIPACQRMVYVNTGWSGPSPVSVTEAIIERLTYEMEQGPTTEDVLESGREIQARLLEAVGQLLNASPAEICLTENTTEGLNIVLNGLSWREGDEIITCNLEHSSVLVPAYYQQRRHGAIVKVLDIAPDEQPDAILGKIEAAITDRTRLVFLSHVEYSSGLRMPAKEIRRLTKDRGIFMLLDGAQTAGHITLDMKDMDSDFYSIPAQKWLLGSEGVGALYIRNDLIPRVEPMQVAGRASLTSADPYQFQPNISSIDKFLLTSTSAPLRAGMLEAIRFIQDIGVEEIESRNLHLATYAKQALQEIPGVTVLSPLDRRSSTGLVSFTIDGVDTKEAVARLWEQHRIVARWVGFPPGIRIALHFFNTEEEVNKVVEAVQELA
jgi:L-cysteine/cystine lyase